LRLGEVQRRYSTPVNADPLAGETSENEPFEYFRREKLAVDLLRAKKR
jgi:hypothetical protein